MKRIILIKYGELTTKKDNRGFFIKTLRKNILNKLTDYNIEIKDDYYRMFIYCEESVVLKTISNGNKDVSTTSIRVSLSHLTSMDDIHEFLNIFDKVWNELLLK